MKQFLVALGVATIVGIAGIFVIDNVNMDTSEGSGVRKAYTVLERFHKKRTVHIVNDDTASSPELTMEDVDKTKDGDGQEVIDKNVTESPESPESQMVDSTLTASPPHSSYNLVL
jgi:hypothetical protein